MGRHRGERLKRDWRRVCAAAELTESCPQSDGCRGEAHAAKKGEERLGNPNKGKMCAVMGEREHVGGSVTAVYTGQRNAEIKHAHLVCSAPALIN